MKFVNKKKNPLTIKWFCYMQKFLLLRKKIIIGVLLDNIEENILKLLWPIFKVREKGDFLTHAQPIDTRRRKLGYPIYIVNIDEGSRSDFMLQNSKSDVFSIVTEYVEVR